METETSLSIMRVRRRLNIAAETLYYLESLEIVLLFKRLCLLYCDEPFPSELLSIVTTAIYLLKFASCQDPRLLFNVTKIVHVESSGPPIYKAYDNRTGEKVCIKRVPALVDDLFREPLKSIELLEREKDLSLENIFTCRDYYPCDDDDNVYVVMDYFRFSLNELLAAMHDAEGERYCFPELAISFIARQVLVGLQWNGPIDLRQLRPDNIFFFPNGEVKVEYVQPEFFLNKKAVGLTHYLAPEVITQSGHDVRALVWSLGIIIYEMAMGKRPYGDLHPMRVLFMIPTAPPHTIEGDFSDSLKNFVSKCLVRSETDRADLSTLMEHDFILDGLEQPGLSGITIEPYYERIKRLRKDQSVF